MRDRAWPIHHRLHTSLTNFMTLYPFKFRSRYVQKMWGGRTLETSLKKPLPPQELIGESWELFDFPPGVVDKSDQWVSAQIANGPLTGRTLHWAVQEFGRDLYGDVPLVGPEGQFPILIKYLDARDDLSLQVHPPAAYAATHPDAHLKSEAWYIVSHEPNAVIYKGLTLGTTRQQFEESIADGSVMKHITAIRVKPGHCHYLPSGTVHALGKGILVAEVQTPQRYHLPRLRFNRVDPSTGQPRTLHVQESLACIDFSHTPEKNPNPAATSPASSRRSAGW